MKNTISKYLNFLGKKVLKLFVFGSLAGLGLYFVEIAFAYSLQIFLVSIGVMDKNVANLPNWLPELTVTFTLSCILVVGLGRALLQWAQVTMQGSAEQIVCTLQRSRILTWAFHSQSVNTAEVMTLFGERNNRAAAIMNSLQALSINCTSALLLGVSLLIMEPVLTLIMGAVLFVVLLLLRGLDQRISFAGVGVATEWLRISERLLVSMKNLLLLQIYGTQKSEENKAQKNLNDYLKHILAYHNLSGLKVALIQLLGVVLICAIVLVTHKMNKSSPGMLLSYFYLFVRFLQTMSSIVLSWSAFLANRPQLEALFKWWELSSFDGPKGWREIQPEYVGSPFPMPIGWRLEGVNFSYPNSPDLILKNISFTILPNKALSITGRSGSGKSTLMNIMLGAQTPTMGSVNIIQGDRRIDVSTNRAQLLASIGYVGPENFVIEGSIRDNILYGLREVPSEQEIQRALSLAECGFVGNLNEGLDYRITEQGEGLSAGQKQRLSLARALLRKPKALILDEATSNLDSETESKLIQIFLKLKSEMTIIFITHRPSLLQIADMQIEL